MYAVFICFSVRPFLRILSIDNQAYSIISWKFLAQFILDLFLLTLNTLKFYWLKFFISNATNRSILQTWFLSNQLITTTYEKFVEIILFLKNGPKDEEEENK
jgi:hypothetical protein